MGRSPRIQLVGRFAVSCEGGRELPLSARRVLAFLALEAGPVSREYLAFSLWPDAGEARATANLRTAVWEVRRIRSDIVVVDTRDVYLEPTVDVDLNTLRAEAMRPQPIHGGARPGDLIKAYGAELLPDWYDDWLEAPRVRWRETRVRALESLSRRLTNSGQSMLATDAALTAIAIEPLRETSQSTLIEAYLAEGNRASALQVLRRFEILLERELGIGPSQHLTALLSAEARLFTAGGPPVPILVPAGPSAE
jgi:DNA-binding SARP family transcriptional activator